MCLSRIGMTKGPAQRKSQRRINELRDDRPRLATQAGLDKQMQRPYVFHPIRIAQEGQITDPADHGGAIRFSCRDVVEWPKRQQRLAENLCLGAEGAMDIGYINPGRGGDVTQTGIGIGRPRKKQHRRCEDAFFPGCVPRRAAGRAGWDECPWHGSLCSSGDSDAKKL